ncbi:hypothetical protein [Sphingobium ummariense]
MRYSRLALAAIACLNIAAGAVRPAAARTSFHYCGIVPPDWPEPGKGRRDTPRAPDSFCHVGLCTRRKALNDC